MAIRIRAFRPEDVRSVFSIHKEHEQLFESFEFSEKFILDISQRRDFRFFVAEEESSGKVVGFSGVLFQPGVGRAEVGPIAVTRAFRSKDCGKMLLEHVIGFLRKEHGIRRVIAKVKTRNEDALRFFVKFGFSKEGQFMRYTRDNEDVTQLVMFL